MQEAEFLQKLGELTALARRQKKNLLEEQVREFARDQGLSEEQQKFVETYLFQQGIRIGGQEPDEDEKSSGNGGYALELYLEELSSIPQKEAQELFELFEKSVDGDEAAQAGLIEAFLPMVCDLAGEYEDPSVLPEDLVQEANICLVTRIRHLEKMDSLAAYQAELMNHVSAHLEETLQEAKRFQKEGSDLAGKADRLHEAIRSLKEELGNDVSIEELSAFLERPAEEIDDLVRLIGEEDQS